MMECYDIIISLASNDQQKENLEEARKRLSQILSSLSFSREMLTAPIGHPESYCRYLNQLAFGKTALPVEELQQQLKAMEQSMGRTAEKRKKGIVPIDLDLLSYGNTRYHLTDWDRPYVKDLMP